MRPPYYDNLAERVLLAVFLLLVVLAIVLHIHLR
jgi:hypothetical protein